MIIYNKRKEMKDLWKSKLKEEIYMKKVIIALMCLFLTGCQMEEPLSEEIDDISTEVEEVIVNTLEKENLVENLPVFFADSLETADIEENFLISSLYCKNRKTVGNQYIIDEEQVLWGYGNNEFGQLGIGRVDFEYHYTEPVKIAENVVSVDASGNGYFAIYLTEDGNLYGMGSNRLGLLGQPYEVSYSDHDYSKVTEPVLLMQDVVYASAGMKSILALKQDGTVWWWGEYSSTYLTEAKAYNYQYYWQDEEDEKNPTKILYTTPKMILEDCIYAVTGDWHGAAITADGELYTWGLNILGECGVKVGDDDYVRIPTKVLDGVSMVWVERINNRGFEQGVYDTSKHRNKYNFNVFVQLKDGTFLAAGKDLGNMQKTIEVTGDIFQPGTETYSDSFVPIMVEEYSEESCRETLNELQWEMTISEAEVILDQQNMDYFETLFPGERIDDERVAQSISVNANSYLLYFDKNKGLYQIDLQEGGSRNGRFSLGMTLEEVQALLDCKLIYEPDVYAQSQVYRTSESIEGTYYTFVFDNTKKTLIIVRESSRLKFRN